MTISAIQRFSQHESFPPGITKHLPITSGFTVSLILSLLTPRTKQVAKLLVTGYTTDQVIADAMGIALKSIRKLMTALFDATGTNNRVELALYIVRHQELEHLLMNVEITESQKRRPKK